MALATLPTPPPGGYRTLVADPPWPIQGKWGVQDGVGARAEVHDRYDLMTEGELRRFYPGRIAADTAHLFVWTTQKFLPLTLELLPWWGFSYEFLMVWHKPGGPQLIGYPQYNCEFIAYGHRGERAGPAGSFGFRSAKNFPACFSAPRGKHSEKPEEFYDLLRRVTPEPRIDLFARKEPPGFTPWGNEIPEESRT